MLRYKTDFLKHLFAFQEWLHRTGIKGNIDPRTLNFTLDTPGRPTRLIAQFVCRSNEGKLFRAQQFNADTVGFVGWLPYCGKQWEIGADKMAFKQFAEFNNLPTPRHARDARDLNAPFIIKQARSSFGNGICGPFLREDSGSPEAALRNDGDFYEQYIVGKIARAWYWNDTLAVIELFDMPCVKGDGRHTIAELMKHHVGADADAPAVLERVLRIQGLRPDTVLPENASATTDFRHGSSLNPTVGNNFNVLRDVWDTPLHQMFVAAGRVFWRGIPKDIRNNTAFVLDAVIDADGKPHFLEMNTNTQIHPDLYPVMLDGLFSVAPVPEVVAEVATEARTNTALPARAGMRPDPALRVTLARPADRQEIEELRKKSFRASKELAWHDFDALDWNEQDDKAVVLAVRDASGLLVSSLRMNIFHDVRKLEEFLSYSVEGAMVEYPTLVMSRAVTHPTCVQQGLMGLLRHVYLRLVHRSGVKSVMAVVYDNAPRVNSMRKAGFILSPCLKHWDREGAPRVTPLLAVLRHGSFDIALMENHKRFHEVIDTNAAVDWKALEERFAEVLSGTCCDA